MRTTLVPIFTSFIITFGSVAMLSAEDHAGHDHGPKETHEPAAGAAHDHAEQPPHGGILQEVGGGHLELVHDAEVGSLTLYVLDAQLAAHAITAKPLKSQIRVIGGTALIAVTLAPPLGDQASEFTGTADILKGLQSGEVIVRIELDGTNERVVFSLRTAAETHHEGDGHTH